MKQRKRLMLVLLVVLALGITLFLCRDRIKYICINHTSYPPFLFPILHICGIEEGPTIPLVEACGHGDMQEVSHLLTAGADPNYTYQDYWTAIEAVYTNCPYEKRLPIAKMLVEYGADVTLFSSDREAVFREAERLRFDEDDPEQVEIILENVSFLLDHGARMIDDRPMWNDSLLHIAAIANSPELAILLVEEYGFDPNYRAYENMTALEVAEKWGNDAVAVYLRRFGNST